MNEAIRIRLKQINDSVESLISSGRDALVKLRENSISLDEARIAASKLKVINERFVAEMYNYFKFVQTPSADELSQYTTIQMQAEEIVAEIDVLTKQSIQNSAIPTQSVENTNLNITSRLPRMELARFDGDVLKWHQFWDQFSSNVDSRNINDVDKLLYLQSVLGGEAKQAIDGLDTTSKNYKIAVDTLKERYGKQGAIVDAHYVALYRIQTAATNSVKDCRNVLNEIERHLRVLKSLGEDVNHNHLRVMIMEKFPEDLIYELRMKLGRDDESIDNIRKGLEYIISARETSNRLKRDEIKTDHNVNENISIGTLHVRSENNQTTEYRGGRGFYRSRIERNQKFENKGGDKFKGEKYKQTSFRKRNFESNKSSDRGEPTPKRSKPNHKCIFCDKEHFNDQCSTVKTLTERKNKLMGRCYNCFSEGHKANDCRSKRKCRHCGKFGLHNRALCPNIVPDQNSTKVLHVNSKIKETVLQTCIVHVNKIGDSTRFLTCRVLLDCGSQRSYITSKAAKELNLPILEENRLSVFTFGAKTPQEIESPMVNFEMVTKTKRTKIIYANVVPCITQSVPCPIGNISNFKDVLPIKDIIFADDGSRNDQVDILLGNDYYYSFMSHVKVEVNEDLFLVKTDFGWIWSGRCLMRDNDMDQLSVLTYFQSNRESETHFYEPDLPLRNDNIKQLWELESIGIVDSPKSTREEEAVKNFNETTKYMDNRYYVKWPWTEYPPATLPVNFGLALGRLTSLIKRLDSKTIKMYDEVIQGQLTKGIIETVDHTALPDDHPVHYLPHHCVLQEGKSTKLRIVYDGSAKVKDNSSLNECLYRGPLMLEELTGLLIRFREHNVAIVSDVEKAFLQVGLQPNDRDVTRFLWIKDLDKGVNPENLIHLRFCRVPFGVISSPFLLNATVRHHLNKSDQEINKQIARDIYVDNLVTGAQSLEKALRLYHTAKKSFEELSMNLREWNSNSKDFLRHISQDDREKREVIKVLGIEWNTNTDKLHLKPNYETARNNMTKRGVLKVTAAIYDPCGFVAPIVLPAKLLLRELWQLKLKWDEALPQNMVDKWQTILAGFQIIKNVCIPRLYSEMETGSKTKYELHCFADAALQAYAAVVYLRKFDEQKNTGSVSFVLGKSRVAPVKEQENLQIPRLELLGAVIGNRLLQYVGRFLTVPVEDHYLWVDSEIVLNWFNSEKLLPPFVARRINELRQNKRLHVRYIPTYLNPADGATRPINSDVANRYWLQGPEFLTRSEDTWPKRSCNNITDNIQMSVVGEGLSEDRIINDMQSDDDTEHVSKKSTDTSLNEGKEISSNVNNRNEQEKEQDDNISMVTGQDAEEETKEIIQLQKQHFTKEYEGQKTDLSRSLNLFIDKKGIMRCAGRFENTGWTDDKKNPILIPKNSDFASKVIENTHKENYHVGVGHTLALVRNKYWIPQGRSQVQKVLRNCLQCRKYGGGAYKMPLMPPLPAERVRYSSPFTFTGIDYFGPLKVNEGSTEKRWICLFTCLAVRAIHMEVVKDLSAEECVMAIRRFVAVRGLPQVIVSDNATQFKLTSEVLTSNYCITNCISWRFIPELAPWFGGFYERLIGLVKNCLKRTLDKHLINQTQLVTIIKEVEAVINTRPLTTVGQELEQVLSPADFLRIGGTLTTNVSEAEFLENATTTKENLIQSWKRGQIILQEFIKMFTSQYLTSLRERKHIHRQSRVVVNKIPCIGDTVQIKGDFNRALWKVGRISAVFKGSDDQIRVAKVQMPGGETLTRSISHLYPLEFEDDQHPHENSTSQPGKPNRDSDKQSDHTTPNIDNTPTLDQMSDLPRNDRQVPEATLELDQDRVCRPTRASAERARDKVKQWTKLLINLIL